MNSFTAPGKANSGKMLIIHADDAGLCHSENQATIQAVLAGMVNSYSIMMPCAWAYEMAQFALAHPEIDYGIHLTLTCEWENYRFGPLSPLAEVPSLVNDLGYFHPNRALVRQHAKADEVKKELKAQIERALKMGLKPTHLDSHMYSVGSRADLLDVYRDLASEYQLPCLINRQMMEEVGLNYEENVRPEDFIIDRVYVGKFADFEKGNLKAYYENILDTLDSGVTIILIHPAFDTPEMQGISVNHPNFGAEWRQIDFDFFTGDQCLTKLRENDITLMTWADLQKQVNPK